MSEQKSTAPSKGVPVQMDRVRYFRYTLGTLRKIREELGDQALAEGVSGDKLGKMFWYGLVGDDPTLSPEAVEDLIDMENLEPIVAAMRQAMGQKAKAEVVPPAAAGDAASA